MDYEKKYKEAFGKAKRLYEEGTITESLCHIFPELKESNGEEIRKNIISYLHNEKKVKRYISDIEFDKWIDWLEKQDKETSEEAIQYLKENHSPSEVSDFQSAMNIAVAKAYDKGMKDGLEKQGEQKSIWHNEDEEPQRDSLILLIMQSGTPIVAKIIEPNHTFNHGEKWAYIDDLLEKNRPQGKSALEAAKEEKVDNQNCVKLADNYKPKFHEGDWICGYYTNYRVTAINSKGYVVEDTDGNKINILFENEKFHHLWSIKDTKKGDVLYSPCLKLLWIFKDKSSVYCGCNLIYNNGAFCGEGYIEMPTDAIPATKEQYNTLFAKMKEAGYEWDAEKKKLRKIDARKNLTLDGDLMQADCMTVEQKPAWREEDEKMLDNCINALGDSSFANTYEIEEWVKSLRQRIGG